MAIPATPAVPVKKTFQYGKQSVTLETGAVARQAGAAVIVTIDDTVVFVSVVGKKEAKPEQDFFPLTVDYMERFYAGGRIPGGFFKREGRPTEKETLTSRLIDRPIRPLFPEGFYNEIQIVAMVMSLNPEIDGDIPAMLGASAALALSGVPFQGPIGAARVGYKDGNYLLNPTASELETSQLDLVVAGTKDAVLMVESEAQMLPEAVMLGAVMYGHEQMQAAIQAINEFVAEAGKPKWQWQPQDRSAVKGFVAQFEPAIADAYGFTEKQARYGKLDEVTKQAKAARAADALFTENHVKAELEELKAKIVRNRILDGAPRIDGRDRFTVRPLAMTTGVLPRTRAARRRLWPSRRWAAARTTRSSTQSKASGMRTSCSTTTSRRTASARPAASMRRSAARSVTAVWPSAASLR